MFTTCICHVCKGLRLCMSRLCVSCICIRIRCECTSSVHVRPTASVKGNVHVTLPVYLARRSGRNSWQRALCRSRTQKCSKTRGARFSLFSPSCVLIFAAARARSLVAWTELGSRAHSLRCAPTHPPCVVFAAHPSVSWVGCPLAFRAQSVCSYTLIRAVRSCDVALRLPCWIDGVATRKTQPFLWSPILALRQLSSLRFALEATAVIFLSLQASILRITAFIEHAFLCSCSFFT
jgi:hypothetical protein